VVDPTPEAVRQAVEDAFRQLAADGYASLTQFQRTVVCVWAACGEIDNGGFDQFFFNSSGDWSQDTPAALREIGASELADIVAEAIARFPSPGPSRDLIQRRQQLDELDLDTQHRMAQLSRLFDTFSIDRQLAVFIERNSINRSK
jgi:hypothetical protein